MYVRKKKWRGTFLKIILYICNLLHKFSVMRQFVFIFLSFILLSCRSYDATTISNLLDLSVNQVYIRKSRIKRQIENSDSENKARFLEMLS